MINSSLHSSAATRDWYVGSSVKYAYILTTTERSTTIIDGLEGYEYGSAEMEIRFDIISIDSANQEYVANMSSGEGNMGEYEGYANAEALSNLLADNLIQINYRWDEIGNRLLLTNFDIYFYMLFFFIEPDWEIFNTNMGRLLNRTQIVDTVVNDPTTYEITFGDFLDSIISYNIMGVSDTVDSQFTLSNSSTKWTFNFDLSNVIYRSVYDYDTSSYFPYSKYTASYTLDFTEGGTLTLLEYNTIAEVTTDDAILEEEFGMIIQEGGFDAVSTPFNFSYSLLSLMILPILIYLSKKKKRPKSGVIKNA